MSDKLTHSADTPESQMTDLAGRLLTEVERRAPSDAFPESGNGCRHRERVGHDQSLRGHENCAEVSGRPATSHPSTNAESMQGAVGTGPTLPRGKSPSSVSSLR